ncbi:hypothetical protein MTO96_003220 [Rhipicephalus appendiculatus]|uniref:Zinc finger, c2h2 type domain containing protein n=1 Tax=Rhipicephalus appendiculatus TaxID=34631 RepID=A0A131Z3M1_RHIAP
MEKKCCIKNCRTNSGKNVKNAVLYSFPKAEGERRAWEKAINVRGFKSDDSTLLCSRHFLKNNFRAIRGRSVLKKGAVPSLELNPKPTKAVPSRPKKLLATEAKAGDVKGPENKTKQKQTIKTPEKKTKQSQSKVQCIAKEPKETEKKNLAKCLVCQQPVAFMYEFLTNAHAHRAYAWKTFICGHCLREFESFSDLMSHVTSIGSAKEYAPDQSQLAPVPLVAPHREYPCSRCSAVFGTATARLYHEVTHTASNEEDLCKQLKLKVKAADFNTESAPIKPRPLGKRRKILAADPSEICLGELQEKEKSQSPMREEGTCRKDGSSNEQQQKKLCKANTPTGRKQLNTLSSLSPQKKQELVSIVYCNWCEQKFMSLRLLDKHYWSQHSNMDIPLDLAFEVGSGDVTPRPTPCSVCAKRTACVKAIQQLLDEAVTDLETIP